MKRRKINCIVFTAEEDDSLFLMLKTIEKRGGFWQGVTGTVENGESFIEAAGRELKEETGLDITLAVRVMEDVHTFNFIDRRDDEVEERVFGIEFPERGEIDLKHNVYEEHERYEWVVLSEALVRLRFDDEKKAFMEVYRKLSQ